MRIWVLVPDTPAPRKGLSPSQAVLNIIKRFASSHFRMRMIFFYHMNVDMAGVVDIGRVHLIIIRKYLLRGSED